MRLTAVVAAGRLFQAAALDLLIKLLIPAMQRKPPNIAHMPLGGRSLQLATLKFACMLVQVACTSTSHIRPDHAIAKPGPAWACRDRLVQGALSGCERSEGEPHTSTPAGNGSFSCFSPSCSGILGVFTDVPSC